MVEVAALDELAAGSTRIVEAGPVRILLCRRGDTVYAVGALCTHARVPLGPGALTGEGLIECPAHGALFDPADGAVRNGPARRNLTVFEITMQDGRIFVDPGDAPAEAAPRARPSLDQGKFPRP